PFLAEFLHHLEGERKNSARTRNARLAALRSFFRYVGLHDPAYAYQCQRVLAMPICPFDDDECCFCATVAWGAKEFSTGCALPGRREISGAGVVMMPPGEHTASEAPWWGMLALTLSKVFSDGCSQLFPVSLVHALFPS